jgi:pimeloyl-ACP methyl ester carboxylesterase
MRRSLAAVVAVVTAALSVAAAAAAGAATQDQLSLSTTTVSRLTVSIDGRSFPARVVRPTDTTKGPFPVVAFGHGFSQTASRYASTLQAIAARGYIVVAPDSETGLFPNHGRLADDLWRAVRWGQAQSAWNPDATRDAVAGHSMGGGAALVAADRYPAIDTVMTLAAAETNPSATTASAGVTVPALYVVGSRDTVVAPSTTRAMYAAKPSPASWVSITGGYHCGFNDSTSFFGLGCDRGGISRASQLAITRELLGDWLDTRLTGATQTSSPAGIVTETK